MIQIQENAQTDWKTERRKDGQTLFHRILPATTGGPKNTQKNPSNYLGEFFEFFENIDQYFLTKYWLIWPILHVNFLRVFFKE